MVAAAVAAMPSSRPVKPRRSLVVAFTATRDSATPEISLIFSRIASRSGPIFGRSQISVTSRLAISAAAGGDAIDGVFQEFVGGRTLPFVIARRKVRADIAIGQRAQDRIDQRVQADVAIGMRKEAAGVGHADAADHQMIAIAEGVHVVTRTHADIAERCCEPRFFAQEIFRCRELHICKIAFKGCHGQSRPFGEGGIVGEIIAAFTCGTTMRFKDDIETKCLWRLCAAQARAVRRRFDMAGLVDLLDRIRNGNAGHRGAGDLRRSDGALDQGGRHERAGGVVDQHNVRRVTGQCFQSGMYGRLSRRAPIRWIMVPEAAHRLVEHLDVIGIGYGLNRKDLGMAAERLHRTRDH